MMNIALRVYRTNNFVWSLILDVPSMLA
jgi:hypothetical protein